MKTYIIKEDVEKIARDSGETISEYGPYVITSLDGMSLDDLTSIINLAIAKVIGEPITTWDMDYLVDGERAYAIKELPND